MCSHDFMHQDVAISILNQLYVLFCFAVVQGPGTGEDSTGPFVTRGSRML